MGLDMYLLEMPKIENMSVDDIHQTEIDLFFRKKDDQELYNKFKPYIRETEKYGHKIVGIAVEIFYWRKANQFHHWFVQNVQNGEDDCGMYEVSQEQAAELHQLCKQVVENHESSYELLPTSSGFFFGSLAHDEIYFHDVKRTFEFLDDLLKTSFFESNYLVYQSSW